MQNTKKKLLAGGVAASFAVSGMVAGMAAAAPAPANAPAHVNLAAAPSATENVAAQGGFVHADASMGTFGFDQGSATPNSQIATTFRGATAALCSATDDFAQVNPLEWKLSVTGDVTDAFTAPVDELANASAVKQTMTCTCGGNPADGRAIITADVKGIPVTYFLDRAGAQAGVNTLTFVASDGTEIAMPLSYAVAHHAVISYEINGEDLSASVGGNNQLWLTGTSANYFIRDIVEVRVTAEEQPPAEPGEGMDYPNSPNVGIVGTQLS